MIKYHQLVQKLVLGKIAKSAYDQPCKWGQNHQGLSALACLNDIYMHLLIQKISNIQDYDLYNRVKVTNIHETWNCPKGMSIMLGRNLDMAQELFIVKTSYM